MRSTIHAFKQIKHDVKYSKAKGTVTTALLNLEITKDKYVPVCNLERKKTKGSNGESTSANSKSLDTAKSAYKNAAQAVEAVKLAVSMEGAKALNLYGNLFI